MMVSPPLLLLSGLDAESEAGAAVVSATETVVKTVSVKDSVCAGVWSI